MARDMTKGNVTKHLSRFAIPLILGNLLQLTYNAADSIIIGRWVGKEALAAVGNAGPVMNITTFFVVGICAGTSVLMSEFFGSGDLDKLKREFSTALMAGGIFTAAMAAIAWVLTPSILGWMQSPEAIIRPAAVYLRIIFPGLFFSFLYNIYAAVLRSIGDSKTPIYFLSISALLNIGLDLYFVAVRGMGIEGVAWTTVIAEIISSVLCIVYVNKRVPQIRLSWNRLHIDKELLKDTISYSWVSGLQQISLYLGKLLIQIPINTLGVDGIAAFNAVDKIDDFAFHPQRSIGNAMTVLIAQNRGTQKSERITAGLRTGILLELASWSLTAVSIFLFAGSIMRLFVSGQDAQVISLGSGYLHLMSLFYILPSLTNGIQGYFRGMGDLKITLASTCVQISGRVLFSFLLIPRIGMAGIAYSCLAGWLCMLAFELPFFYNSRKKGKENNKWRSYV